MSIPVELRHPALDAALEEADYVWVLRDWQASRLSPFQRLAVVGLGSGDWFWQWIDHHAITDDLAWPAFEWHAVNRASERIASESLV